MKTAKVFAAILFGVSVLLTSCQKEPEPISVTGISLDSSSLTLIEGETARITATISPSNADNQGVIWSSSNASVASVSNGTVTAVSAGSATITAKSDDGGKTATCNITVNSKIVAVKGVSLDKTSLELTEGDEYTLVATVLPENASNKSVSWKSEDETIATVSDGKVKAIKPGNASISVKTEDGGKTASCEITVIERIYPVESVSLDKTSLELTEGDEATLTATIKPDNASNKQVSWKSEDETIATVSDGKVKAIKSGNTTITVTTSDGNKTASCSIIVNEKIYHVESISLNRTSLELMEGDEFTLVATIAPSNADNQKVIWTSSDNAVASVDGGKVKALKQGSTTITAKTDDGGKTATCELTVLGRYVDLGLSVMWATCNLGASSPEEYGLYYQWGDTQGWGSDSSDGKNFFWDDYKWCNGSTKTLTKYNTKSEYGTVDNKTVLDKEDDAAYVALGGKWRTPTIDEWRELKRNCTWRLTYQNGVMGFIVTSKKQGYTDKSIFLPKPGYRIMGGIVDVGLVHYYWSSSLNIGTPTYAYCVYFYSGGSGTLMFDRIYGYSIRPVYE